MRYITIGSGTSVPQAGRSAPCHLVKTGGQNIVIDLGPGSVWGLVRYGRISPADVGLILITHLHLDHCSDLAPLLFALRSKELVRTEPLMVLGPAGLMDHFSNIRRTWGNRVDPSGFDLIVDEWKGSGFSWRGIDIEAAPTSHSILNLAWCMYTADDIDCGIVITGDGRSTRELVNLGVSRNHVLVAESAAGPGEDSEGHMNPAQAGQLASACRSRELVLSHIGPHHSPEAILKEASAHFDGRIVVAEDGMEMEIG